MNTELAEDELALAVEPVERRIAPRGPVRDLMAAFTGGEGPVPVVEAGLTGMFVAVQALDRFTVGDIHEVTLTCRELSLTCEVQVVRKENGRRHGVAFRVVRMSEEAHRVFEEMRS